MGFAVPHMVMRSQHFLLQSRTGFQKDAFVCLSDPGMYQHLRLLDTVRMMTFTKGMQRTLTKITGHNYLIVNGRAMPYGFKLF